MAALPDSELLARARTALESGQLALAAQSFDALLALRPDSLAARQGRARCALLAGQPALAIEQLQVAARIAPDDALVARNLGLAWLACAHVEAAIEALRRACALEPGEPRHRLHLGQAYEQQGQPLAAARHYYRALVAAQARGQWLDAASTPPGLRPAVLRAMDRVDQDRGAALQTLIQPWIERHGTAAMQRVQRCLDLHLKRITQAPADPQQRPRFLFFPDLPSPRFFERSRFDWIERCEAAFAAVREEAAAVLADPQALRPFLSFQSADQVGDYLAGRDTEPGWDAFFFYRDGERFDEQHRRCPTTSALLESLPLVRIRQHAPEICFSVLAPGTRILRHTGVTNVRLVAHLPLIVPAGCAIEVGGETHAWREGEVVVFDDTYEHEAWNDSAERRVILLMDTWNPYLQPPEREAISALIAGIGDFNREE